tara:strand:- start:93 stop:236 length:144 start_codon:yes stop_codon:yes gene_type:complete
MSRCPECGSKNIEIAECIRMNEFIICLEDDCDWVMDFDIYKSEIEPN